MIACPKLTELTMFFPHRYQAKDGKMDFLSDQARRARDAIFNLVGACKVLPDFATLQIVRFPINPPHLACWCGREECSHRPSMERWEQALTKQMKDLEERAMDCLRMPRTGCREGEGRRLTLRVIKFRRGCRPAKVEECEV